MDWGLGHATRCIPVIKEVEKSCEVIIAGSGASLELLKQEFPAKKFFELPSYGITYSNRIPLLLHMALQSPKIVLTIRKEYYAVEKILKAEKIDFIISDNRYGCFNESIPSSIIIHQLSLIAPLFANYYNQRLIRRFNECWVPDTPDNRLSGKLSINKSVAHKFIGPLSRMTFGGHGAIALQILALVSGPEPYRSLFEELLARELPGSGLSYRIVRGLPNKTESTGKNNSTNKKTGNNTVNHLPSKELNDLVAGAEIVISRSGYSTIMDLAALKKKAIFVPTPGQTEQLYLARELERKKIAPMYLQKDLSLPAAVERSKQFSGFTEDYFDNSLLTNTLREFLG